MGVFDEPSDPSSANSTGGGGGPTYYPPIDPGGLQSSSTAAVAVGTGFVAASDGGDTVASALGFLFQGPDVMSAGFSLAAFRGSSLLTAGLILLGAGIFLNVASLVIRWQMARRT